MNEGSAVGKISFLALFSVGALIGIICLFGFIGAFEGTDPGKACVIQEGGPMDGRGVKRVRQGGEGVSNIGIWNKQRCFPATERNYIVSADAAESDNGNVDFVEVPTIDAVNVRLEGQALFRLNTDPKVMEEFYKKFGVRSYDGVTIGDNEDEWWEKFLAVQFRPILDNALRSSIGSFRCVELNNTCQYVQNAEKAVKGETDEVDNSQNLQKAQEEI